MTLEAPTAVWLPGETDSYQQRTVVDNPELHVTVETLRGTPDPTVTMDTVGGMTSITVDAGGGCRVTAVRPTRDAVALWRPGSGHDHANIPASWEDPEPTSAFRGMPIGALLGPDDHTLLTFGGHAGTAPIAIRAGLIEETADLLVSFETTSMSSLTVHLDTSGDVFAAAVSAMTNRLTGPRPAPAVDDEKPVLCTWYFVHQDVNSERISAQARPAAELGFGTLIVDDGWQTRETTRGYGSGGDWRIESSKIPDPTELVTAFADHGIRTMWWIGTPFLGHRSDAITESAALHDLPPLDAAILDPRDRATRQRLTDRIAALIRDSGAHGLKLDFIDQFAGIGEDVDRAALELLDDIGRAIRTGQPDPSIEFREPYFGPDATERATMIRVGDCPMSPVRNRVGIADLRLSTNGIAVHADPVMWGDDDSTEHVAVHLQNTIFGVPQVSMDLLAMRADHAEVLRFWLRFWLDHRDTLLHGEFQARRPDLRYPFITAHSAEETITARYLPVALDAPDHDWRRWIVVNAAAPTVDIRGLVTDVDICTYDALGRVVVHAAGKIAAPLEIPQGGVAIITRTSSEPRHGDNHGSETCRG